MESPIVLFLQWLDSESENKFAEDIPFHFLVYYPGYGIDKLSEGAFGGGRKKLMTDLLSSITDPKLVVGMSLTLDNIVSFMLKDYDDLDKTLDATNIFDPSKATSEKEKELLENTQQMQFQGIEPRRLLKESWDSFRSTTFNYEYFDRYLLEEDFLKWNKK